MELVVIVVAIALGSFVKGVTGSGLPQIAIPVMATFLGVERAVVVMAIPGVASNAWLVWSNRDAFELTRDLPSQLVTGTFGAVAGTVLLKEAPADILSAVLALLILAYVAIVVLHPGFSLSRRFTRIASPPVGLVAGGLQGVTGVSGPLVSTYLHGFSLPPHAYILSITVVFIVFSIVQTVTLFGIGLYTPDRVGESLLALIPIAMLLPLGSRLSRRVSVETFKRLILALLVVTAAKLLYDAFVG